MSGPSAPPDNSLAVEAMRQKSADEARAQERADQERRRGELATLRSGAGSSARSTAKNYFTRQGLDAEQYAPSIDEHVNAILGSISPDDPNPGSYFNNIGQSVYGDEEAGYRGKLTRDLDKLFPTNFERSRISDQADDPYLTDILGEERGSADRIVQNMLDRGVITPQGASSAEGDLDRQAFGVKSRLNELGSSTLESGRQKLRDISNQGHQAASTINLGSSFDPYSFGSSVDQAFNDFVGNLGGNIRAKLSGPLFDTKSLAAIAGAGQGAQNTSFDPMALAGIIDQGKKKKTTETSPQELVF